MARVYRLCLLRDFIARHALVGGEWGGENLPHSHFYKLEWRLEGAKLDDHGFLVDLVALESVLDSVVASVRDKHLNDLVFFRGRNPSVEHFARYLSEALADSLDTVDPHRLVSGTQVRLWEHEQAWASWAQSRPERP